LVDLGVELIATDGTRRALAAAGIDAMAVADVTGFPEMLDGRVKTLHPAIHAGILARRDLPDHMSQLEQNGFTPIDIVAVSLYPFAKTLERGAPEAEIIENIDVGGPTLIRAAAKNCEAVAVVVDPGQYASVLTDLTAAGQVRRETRRRLAAEAFAHVAAYDTAVAQYLAASCGAGGMPAAITVGGALLHDLRYGENPHQAGALYRAAGQAAGMAHASRRQGPDLSFTNWLDADTAWRIVSEFDEPAVVIVKHANPCGFAVGATAADAYRRALECDPRSAFGGVVGLNRPLDRDSAGELARTFLEVVVAPDIEGDALEQLGAKQRLRVLAVNRSAAGAQLDVRSIDGGLLVQTADRVSTDRAVMRVATERSPSEDEWRQLLLAWRLCRHVKSNAIVIVRDGMAVGIGAGQMSRVEAAELAVRRAADRAGGAVSASDAFFPMPDGLETLGRAGVAAVIQPGGSKKDADVTAAADALGMAMVMAGERHFRH